MNGSSLVVFPRGNELQAPLPNEIWAIILHYVASGSNLRHITAMALVSKAFLECCLAAFPISRMGFVHINTVSLDILNQLPIVRLHNQDTRICKQELLAIDGKGRQYTHCSEGYGKHILIITDLSTMSYTLLDLEMELKKARQDPHCKTNNKNADEYYSHYGQTIVSCHPLDDRLIIVTDKGYSIWNYDRDGKLLFGSFDSPIGTKLSGEILHENIVSSCYLEDGRLLLQTRSYSQNNIYDETKEWITHPNDENPTFSPLLFSQELEEATAKLKGCHFWAYRFSNMEGKPCFNTFVQDMRGNGSIERTASVILCGIEIVDEGSQLKIKPSTTPKQFSFEGYMTSSGRIGQVIPRVLLIGSPKWSIHIEKEGHLYVFKEGDIWIGEELKLKAPNIHWNDVCFIHEDFLFISYNNSYRTDKCSFRLIHLPTKQDYTPQCGAIIHEYLQQHPSCGVLFWLKIRQEGEERYCDLICQKQEGPELIFYSVTISLSALIPKKQALPHDRDEEHPSPTPSKGSLLDITETQLPSSHLVIEQPTLSEHHVSKIETPASCLTGKVIVVAGVAFLALTAIVSGILIALHPGTIIYKGSGLILTLPAMLSISIGGFAALLAIAIGSYRWWKEKPHEPLMNT